MKISLPALIALSSLPIIKQSEPTKPFEQAVKALAISSAQIRKSTYNACKSSAGGLFPPASQLPIDLNQLRSLIDKHEETLYAYMGKRCEAKDVLDDISIVEAAVVQDKAANCVALSTFMAVAEHDPAHIPRIIRSLGKNHWEVSLHDTQGKLQKIEVTPQLLKHPVFLDINVNMGYQWPRVLSAALEMLRAYDPNHSKRSSKLGAACYEQLEALYGPGVGQGGFRVKPIFQRHQLEGLLQQVEATFRSMGTLDADGNLNRPAVFASVTVPEIMDSTVGPFGTGHVYELLAIRRGDQGKTEIVLRNPYMERGTTLDERSGSFMLVVTHLDIEKVYDKYPVFNFEFAYSQRATVSNPAL
ncbi:MAG: hypothetical protein QE278_06385 [Limnobacter sp.]|nr:hypothetical protein [Limnobacter sp.]